MTADAPGAPAGPGARLAPGSAPRPAGDSWPGRPPGMPGDVPPPSLPLGFLAAAALGLAACGAMLAWARTAGVADPTADRVVGAAHLGMLATLSMGVLGAMHQFTPVVTQRPLRSVRLGRATFLAWLAGAWLLPLGFVFQQEGLVEAGGAFAATAVAMLVANLWRPLSVAGKGAPVAGLRLAVAGFVATAAFGLVYVADRRGAWFALDGHVVLAHVVIGLFAWLGLTYVSVAEKLWPMFFLAHVPGPRRAPWIAVLAMPGGVALGSPGLLLGVRWLAWGGAAVLTAGLAAHLVSLWAYLRHRRRKPDLYLAFVVTAAFWLVAGAGLALAAALAMGRAHHAGMALAAAAVGAFGGWLLTALVGHAHKVVPFIGWSVLRGRGIGTVAGRPLGFADLYDHRLAVATYGLVTAGIAAVCAGFGASLPALIAAGGALLAAAGVVAGANLAITPFRLLRSQGNRGAARPARRGATRPAAPQAGAAQPAGMEAAGAGAAEGMPGAAASPTTAAAAAASRTTGAAEARSGAGAKPPGQVAGGRQGGGGMAAWMAVAIAVVAALMAASALWPSGSGGTGQAGAAGLGAHVVANGQVKTFGIELGDMYVRPSAISVPYGTRVVLRVVNHGAMSHDLQLEGGRVGPGLLAPGQGKTVDYGVFGQTEQAWCTVPGHKEAGMVLTIKVTGRAGSSAAGTSGGRSGSQAGAMSGPMSGGSTAGASARDATINFGARPGAGWRPFNAALAPAPGGTVHRVTLIAEDKVMQVAPGVTQDMWTFNGQVPGPTLRGHAGDLFIVTLVNHSTMGHSLDFHAASQPMEAMRTIGPGQSMTERFRANYSGLFLYHCGTAPVLEHLANGMFGAVVIDPPHLDPVAHEFLIVQSELYLGPQGRSGDYAKMLRGQPDAEVFNGYADQYLFSPLQVRAGQRIRIWVLDAGPSDDSAFHVVGAQFDTVFNNGAYLLRRGNPADGAAQTLNLMPGEGGFVELTVPGPGMYELVDHHFDRAAVGAAGDLMAGPQR